MSKREKFQAYPYYMKHTIFQEDEEMQQIRNCSFETRLQAAYENLDKGNKAFKSERFPEALASYERVFISKYSLFLNLIRPWEDSFGLKWQNQMPATLNMPNTRNQ